MLLGMLLASGWRTWRFAVPDRRTAPAADAGEANTAMEDDDMVSEVAGPARPRGGGGEIIGSTAQPFRRQRSIRNREAGCFSSMVTRLESRRRPIILLFGASLVAQAGRPFGCGGLRCTSRRLAARGETSQRNGTRGSGTSGPRRSG